uniref:Variant 2 major surface glycoprotein n=1 Tax=Pneumocystis carinii TaxID=4754 RepID=O94173_PNECA|nr:variant 2 major surface glycoprotein [Pneumocystis carinii]
MFFSMINKIIVLGILILIVPIYGNQNTHLRVRDSPVSAENMLFEDFVVKEEDIVAYILGEDYEEYEKKCKSKLEEYCNELKVIDPELNKVHTKVKEICDNIEQKCAGLNDKIEVEFSNFNRKLYDALGNLKDQDCKNNEEKCIFLEEAFRHDDPKENCVKLRERCYKLKRQKVADELLLRALGKNVKENDKCKEKMETICPVLSRESDEFMFSCLNLTKTCDDLKSKLGSVCLPLKEELKDDKLEEKCYERLEKCHFYGEACDDAKCQVFEEECKKNNITYKAPESDFSPVKPRASLLTMIGLEDVYKNAEKDGILIGKAGVDVPRKLGIYFLQDILLLLSQDVNEMDTVKKCNIMLERCNDLKHLGNEMTKLCEDGGKENKCKKILDVNVKERCTKFKSALFQKDLSTQYNDDEKSELLPWGHLPTFFTKGECTELVSECFYLKNACTNKIDQACQNVHAACYKIGKDRILNKFFQKELRGKLGDLRFNSESLKKCQEYVVENCTKLDERYLPKCLYPKRLCYVLSDNIVVQSRELGVLLDGQRDSPLEKHCLELGEKCDELDRDSNSNSRKCATLKILCEYFRVAEKFRKVFLKREDDALYDEQNCTKALHEKCDTLSRGENPFSISCALPRETCKYMVHHTRQDCRYLKDNMKNEGILEKIEDAKKANANETLVEELCTTWGRHCHQLVKNCPDQLGKEKNGNDQNCEKLDEKCRDTFKKLKSKDELTHLLKGSLSNDKCKDALKKHCPELQKNGTFKILIDNCEDNTVKELCEKLVEKVQNRCPTLKTDLEKAKDELTEKKDEYEKAKQAAEKSTEAAKLLLSRQNSSDSEQVSPPLSAAESSSGSSSELPPPPPPQNGTPGTPDGASGTPGSGMPNYVKFGLVKREYVAEGVSEAEVKAFDATTIALELYLELKEECKALELDCGFREDCPNSKEVCGEIDTLCKEIEPLKDKPYEKITEPCTLLQTTDIWVTSTSIVTSTVTSTSMRRCKPTKCTTDSSKETQKGEEEEEVKPNDGMKIRVPDMIKIMLLGVIVMGMM